MVATFGRIAHLVGAASISFLSIVPIAAAQYSVPAGNLGAKTYLAVEGTTTRDGEREYVTQGQSFSLLPGEYSITARPSFSDYGSGVRILVRHTDPNRFSDYFDLEFSSEQTTNGRPAPCLVPGAYANATRFPFNTGTTPGLSVSGMHRGCNRLQGRFVVHQVEYCNKDSLRLFSASFVQYCDNSPAPLFGSVRYESPYLCRKVAPTRTASLSTGKKAKKARRKK